MEVPFAWLAGLLLSSLIDAYKRYLVPTTTTSCQPTWTQLKAKISCVCCLFHSIWNILRTRTNPNVVGWRRVGCFLDLRLPYASTETMLGTSLDLVVCVTPHRYLSSIFTITYPREHRTESDSFHPLLVPVVRKNIMQKLTRLAVTKFHRTKLCLYQQCSDWPTRSC